MKDKVKIIAEAGLNHNGDFKKIIKLIDIAKKAEADYVKFQLFKTENFIIIYTIKTIIRIFQEFFNN